MLTSGNTVGSPVLGSWQNVSTMEEALDMIAKLEEELTRTLSIAEKHANGREKAQMELDNLRQVAEDVNAENDMIVNDMQDLYAENDQIHDDLKAQRQANEEMEKKIERVQLQCEELQDRIEACHGQSVDPEDVQEAVKQLRSTGNKKLKEAAQERQTMEEMVDKMREELNDARENMIQLVTEKDDMIRRYKALQKKLKKCGCQGSKLIHEACSKSIMSDDESNKRWRSQLRKHLGGHENDPPKVVAIDGAKQTRKNSTTGGTGRKQSKTKRFSAMGVFSDQAPADTNEPKFVASSSKASKDSSTTKGGSRESKTTGTESHGEGNDDDSEPGDNGNKAPNKVKLSMWGSKVFERE